MAPMKAMKAMKAAAAKVKAAVKVKAAERQKEEGRRVETAEKAVGDEMGLLMADKEETSEKAVGEDEAEQKEREEKEEEEVRAHGEHLFNMGYARALTDAARGAYLDSVQTVDDAALIPGEFWVLLVRWARLGRPIEF